MNQSNTTDSRYLRATPLLNFNEYALQEVIAAHGWRSLPVGQRIGEIYRYVRDDIRFGYNVDDAIPATRVLSDGYGQCNTKATLLMALLRAVEIPCRIHGFTIDKALQKGVMTGFVYRQAPQNVLHSWVEVWFEEDWRTLEGVILDKAYLTALQARFPDCDGAFCGYGVAVKDFRHPPVAWNGGDTYIQSEGINQDFGLFDSPDVLLKAHQQQLSPLKGWMYRQIGRQLMNRNVGKLRKGR